MAEYTVSFRRQSSHQSYRIDHTSYLSDALRMIASEVAPPNGEPGIDLDPGQEVHIPMTIKWPGDSRRTRVHVVIKRAPAAKRDPIAIARAGTIPAGASPKLVVDSGS